MFDAITDRSGAEMISIRRHLHRIPEIGLREYKTSGYILQKLKDIGIDAEIIGDTGVVGIIKGEKNAGKTILLRADIDGLPLQEDNDLEYRSIHEDMMHACGHDAHAASLIGAAYVLYEKRREISGTVKLVFQPAEENIKGALLMIEKGVLEDPKTDACFALHMWPGLPVGKAAVSPGSVLAACDFFDIEITGQGGHAAQPWITSDTVLLGARIITEINNYVMRRVKLNPASVVTVCAFNSGNSYNVIPGKAFIKGTIRTLDTGIRMQIHENIRTIASKLSEISGAQAFIDIKPVASVTINDPVLTDLVKKAISGPSVNITVVNDEPTSLASEDFSFYSAKVPSVMVFVGCSKNGDCLSYPLHNSRFNIDEAVLPIAAGIYSQVALSYLE